MLINLTNAILRENTVGKNNVITNLLELTCTKNKILKHSEKNYNQDPWSLPPLLAELTSNIKVVSSMTKNATINNTTIMLLLWLVMDMMLMNKNTGMSETLGDLGGVMKVTLKSKESMKKAKDQHMLHQFSLLEQMSRNAEGFILILL